MMGWLRRRLERLRGRPDRLRHALEECHAEAWTAAEQLMELQERGIRPAQIERERTLEALTRICRTSARELGWLGD